MTIEVPPATGATVQAADEEKGPSGQEVGKPVESTGIEEQVNPEPRSEEEKVESLVQEAEVAMDGAAIGKQGDLGPAFQNGVSDLAGSLGSIVDFLVGKVDALAEVRLNFAMP